MCVCVCVCVHVCNFLFFCLKKKSLKKGREVYSIKKIEVEKG